MKIENQRRLKNSNLNLILTSNIHIHVGIQTFIVFFFLIFFFLIFLANMSGVSKIQAREIFDSRGNPTVEVDITTSKGE